MLLLSKLIKKPWLFPLLASCLLVSTTHAATFVNSDITPTAAGAANAVVTGSGHLTDAFYNPSALAWQEGVQAMFVNQTRYRNSSVDVAGVGYDGKTKPSLADAFAISWVLILSTTAAFGFDNSQMASFYLSNDEWEKGEELTLFDMNEPGAPEIRMMKETVIGETLVGEGDKLLYVFDFLNIWTFNVEL
ncbi:MAG: hypothetical protein COB79_04285, partial [Zetaproteobacteria bacterium]